MNTLIIITYSIYIEAAVYSKIHTLHTTNKHNVCCHAFWVLVNNLMDSVPRTVIFLQDCKHQLMHMNWVIRVLDTDVIQQENIKYSLAILFIQHLENTVTQSLSHLKTEKQRWIKQQDMGCSMFCRVQTRWSNLLWRGQCFSKPFEINHMSLLKPPH